MVKRCQQILLLVLMILFTGLVYGKESKNRYSAPITLEDYIQANCKKGCVSQEDLLKSVHTTANNLRIDFMDLLAITRVESAFVIKARSGKNHGLMQVNLRYHRSKFDGRNPFDIESNMEIGAGIYKECLVKHQGNRRKSLACFNGSKGNKYANKVLKAYKEIAKLVDLELQHV